MENTPDINHLNNSTFISLDEYRAIAETAEERLEYRNGEVFILPGGTANHSAIACSIDIITKFPQDSKRTQVIRSIGCSGSQFSEVRSIVGAQGFVSSMCITAK